MPRLKTQEGWVTMIVAVPVGFIAAVLLAGDRMWPKQGGFADFVRLAITERVSYTPDLDKDYIRDAIERNLFSQSLIEKAIEQDLYHPPK